MADNSKDPIVEVHSTGKKLAANSAPIKPPVPAKPPVEPPLFDLPPELPEEPAFEEPDPIVQKTGNERMEAALKKFGEAMEGLSDKRKWNDGKSFKAALEAAEEMGVDTSKIVSRVTSKRFVTTQSVGMLAAVGEELANKIRDGTSEDSKKESGEKLTEALHAANNSARRKNDVGVKPPNLKDMIAHIKGESPA